MKAESGAGGAARSTFGIRHSFVIRLSSFVILAAALAWLGHRVLTLPPAPFEMPAAPPIHEPPTTTNTDATDVFQKAFWKRPTAADKILHAERREWADADGVQKWQWFIAVEPSPELVKRLREDNAFNLVPAASAPRIDERPAWFAFEPGDVDVLQSPQGNLRLIFGRKSHTLYATDSGRGFRAGAPEVPKPVPQVVSTGRLPSTHPPIPPPQ